MTYGDVVTYAISAFGSGLVFGMMIGIVANFMRSFSHH